MCSKFAFPLGKSTLGFEWGEGDGKGIARFTLDNGVRVSIDDHRFRTEWFQIGYFDSSNQWVELYRREGRGLSGTYPVTFNPSSVPLTHALQAAVKYENCCEVVYSEPQEIHQRASRELCIHITHYKQSADGYATVYNQLASMHAFIVQLQNVQVEL